MRIFFMFLTLSSFLFANETLWQKGEPFKSFWLPDQFERYHSIDSKTKTVVVAFEKDAGSKINDFLSKQDTGFLKERAAFFVADISQMPSIITTMFALPKMQTYAHAILLIQDKEISPFKEQEGKTTVYKLKSGVVQEVLFVDELSNIKEFF